MSTAPAPATLEATTTVAGNGTSAPRAPFRWRSPMTCFTKWSTARSWRRNSRLTKPRSPSILVEYLGNFARTTRLGRAFILMLFRIDQAQNLQRRPDVAFVSHTKWPVHRRLPDVEAWDMVPDLAIEIVSPSNTADDVHEKIHEVLQGGSHRGLGCLSRPAGSLRLRVADPDPGPSARRGARWRRSHSRISASSGRSVRR